jgi:cation transport ATPase
MIAAATMSFSSVSVIVDTLRARRPEISSNTSSKEK